MGGKDRFTGVVDLKRGINMAVKEEIAQIRQRMEKAIEDFRKELATIRTGRASISILDNIQVEYYGTPTPINQVAQLATPDPTLITVQPYDVSLVGPVEKVDSRVGPRSESFQRRPADPNSDSATHRRSPEDNWPNTSTKFWKITARPSATSAATETIT